MKYSQWRDSIAARCALPFLAMFLIVCPSADLMAAGPDAKDAALESLAREGQPRSEAGAESPVPIPGELIVKLEGSARPSDLAEIREVLEQSANGQTKRLFRDLPSYASLVERFPVRSARASAVVRQQAEARLARLDNVYKVTFDPSIDVLRLAGKLLRSPQVVYAEPNFNLELALLPDDPFWWTSGSWDQDYDDLWGLKLIDAEHAWDHATGAGIVVAVSDTGVFIDHPDLDENIWDNPIEILHGLNGIDDDENGRIDDLHGWNIIDDNNDLADVHGHGTHVSGTIAAEGDNGLGIIGVAYDAKIMPVRCFDGSGHGTMDDGAESILYASLAGADVINMSWSTAGNLHVLQDAVMASHALGVVLVAAAGNDSSDVKGYFPAAYPEVLGVSATDHLDVPATFSNWGELISVGAPGGDSTIPDDPNHTYRNILSLRAPGEIVMSDPVLVVAEDYYRARGTSMASPHVAGVAALVSSAYVGPDSMNNELLQLVIESSADDVGAPGFDVGTGHGRVNAHAAVTLSLEAIGRPELIAGVSTDTMMAAPNSPVAVVVTVKNVSATAATNVSVGLFDGEPDAGNPPLQQWTVPVIAGEGVHEATVIISLSTEGNHDLHLIVDPAEEETSVENNEARTGVGVAGYQYQESVVADDEGLTPVSFCVSQKDPAISGDRVVWTDDRDSQEPYDGIKEIYMLDLSTGIETRLTSAPSSKQYPDISGDRVVWIDRRNGHNDIFLHDLSTGAETQITADTLFRSAPRIDGDWVVWSDASAGNNDVYACNVVWGATFRLTTDPASQSTPSISGDKVVWLDYRSGSKEIYAYDLSIAGESLLFSDPDSTIMSFADISGDKIVWTQGHFNSPQDMDLGVHMLDLTQPPAVQLTGEAPGGDWTPAISGNGVAWIRGFSAPDIFAMDLESGVATPLTTSGGVITSALDVGDGRVVWEEYRNFDDPYQDHNIYMAERNPFPAAPVSLTASNGGSGTINLDWSDNAESDLAGYAVYRKPSPQGPFAYVGTATLSDFTDTGLTNGIRYYYRVCAVDDANGESAFSNESSAVPKIIKGGSPIFRKPNIHELESK